MKVHKGDTVLVVSGKDKGAKGKVLQAYPERNKVLVEGVNRIKKHTAVSRNERGASSGGIVTQLLVLAVALGAVTGPAPSISFAVVIAVPAIVGLVVLFAAARHAGTRRRTDAPQG